jgi:hypothetical protein
MQCMRRFFVPVWLSKLGLDNQILRVEADCRVRPHRSSMQFESIQLSCGYPHFTQPLVGAGLCACPHELDRH